MDIYWNWMAKRGLEDCRLREQRMKAERDKELARLVQEKKRREEEETTYMRDVEEVDIFLFRCFCIPHQTFIQVRCKS